MKKQPQWSGEQNWKDALRSKVERKTAVVGVIGLGYVGLPLSVTLAGKFTVLGFDSSEELITNLRRGRPGSETVTTAALESVLGTKFFPSSDASAVSQCDFLLIAVPTPLTRSKEPDLTFIEDAGATVAEHLRRGQFVILESTSFPGTTREILVPILETSGLRAGLDFGVAYSPERVDPGNKRYEISNTPKLVGGIDSWCTETASAFYQTVVDRVIEVNNSEVAEAAKMLENIFRAVNIALVNELTLALERMDIDVWEVIEAASTKPFGFMPFRPGPGIGGHCIPLDPYYFSYAAKRAGLLTRFIELSGDVNSFMPFHVVGLLDGALRSTGRSLRGSRIAVLGLSYKHDVSDTRESPSIKVIDELARSGGIVSAYDPLAKGIQTASRFIQSASTVESALDGADAAIILVDHSTFRALPLSTFRRLMGENPVILDCQNVIARPPPGTVYLGLGKRRHLQGNAASNQM